MTPEAPVELVSDAVHVQLSRLVLESAWRVDVGRAYTLHELFVEEGVLEVDRPYRGWSEIQAWGAHLEKTKPYEGIRHSTSNMRFTRSGQDAAGRDTASGVTMLTVFLADDDGCATTIPWVVGEDHDSFVLTDQGWRFTHRSWVQLFQRT
ncbi:MAG: nuclear transport factor 2 family protein [Nocardioides sp.]